jgi:lipid-A-disaccharide synthase
LETALFGVPEVVCYKGNTMSYWIARQLVKIKYISLVNLIMDREVVCELIQDEMQPERLFEEMKKVIEEGESRTTMLQQFQKLKELLGGAGASENAASLIINYMHKGT